MKKYQYLFSLVIPAVLLIICCGTQYDTVTLDDDGYGTMTLPNGVEVIINQDASTQLTAARILIGGGTLTETADNNGISNLMIRMLLKGNDRLTAEEISEQIEFLGATVSADCYSDYCVISILSLTDNFEQTLDIVSRSVLAPTFPDDELAKLKTEVEGDIKATNDNQGRASSNLFYKTAFGDSDYGLPTLGTEESIQNISIADIRAHYDKYVGGGNMIFAISSSLPANKASEIAYSYLSGIKPDAATWDDPMSKLADEKLGFISFDRNQSFVYTGYVLDNVNADEVPYLMLIHEIMGNNVGSRLWFLRQKEKLAYSVFTQYRLNKYNSVFRAGIGTDTTKVRQALSSLNRELSNLVDNGITEAELADAKMNLKNNLIYRVDTKGNRVFNMVYYDHIGYGYRYIQDLFANIDTYTVDDINSFVSEEFTKDRLFTSVVGKK